MCNRRQVSGGLKVFRIQIVSFWGLEVKKVAREELYVAAAAVLLFGYLLAKTGEVLLHHWCILAKTEVDVSCCLRPANIFII